MDLLDLGSPRLSLRRLVVLVRNLPRDSLLVRELVGDAARWGEAEHLLADLVDLTQMAMWQFAQAHSKRRVRKPKPIRRPGREVPGERRFGNARMTIDQARRYLDRFRPRKGGGDVGS